MLKIEGELSVLVERISVAETENFQKLVHIAGLDPSKDFRFANLQDVDFTDSDLSEFDLTFADLRGAKWDLPKTHYPKNFHFALRGRKRDAIRATDFEDIKKEVINGRTWPDRFFAFSLIIDNFGENVTTLNLMKNVVGRDRSVYYRWSAFTYFCASISNQEEMMAYCKVMAENSNSRMNMFRFPKLRRFAEEVFSYNSLWDQRDRFPGDITAGEFGQIFEALKPRRRSQYDSHFNE